MIGTAIAVTKRSEPSRRQEANPSWPQPRARNWPWDEARPVGRHRESEDVRAAPKRSYTSQRPETLEGGRRPVGVRADPDGPPRCGASSGRAIRPDGDERRPSEDRSPGRVVAAGGQEERAVGSGWT